MVQDMRETSLQKLYILFADISLLEMRCQLFLSNKLFENNRSRILHYCCYDAISSMNPLLIADQIYCYFKF